jgi:hypothetical protein
VPVSLIGHLLGSWIIRLYVFIDCVVLRQHLCAFTVGLALVVGAALAVGPDSVGRLHNRRGHSS